MLCLQCVMSIEDPAEYNEAVIVVAGNSMCGLHAAEFLENIIDTDGIVLHTEN